MSRFLLGAVLVIALASCAMAQGPGAAEASPAVRPSSATTFVLTVTNLDGPKANVLIGDRKVATLNCWDHPLALAPGDPALPPLPWTVTILDISHSPALKTLGVRTEAGNGPSAAIVIRVDHLDGGPIETPLVAPASCPPAPSAETLY